MAVALRTSAQMAPSIIPLPKEMVKMDGELSIKGKIYYHCDDYQGDSIRMVFDRFARDFTSSTGIKFKKAKKATFSLTLDNTLQDEQYSLYVDRKGIRISASRPPGFYYGLNTIMQLLPSRRTLSSCKVEEQGTISFPFITIKRDGPEYSWRGFMLDEGRHFFGKETVKEVIDIMARYKMNRLHWHLTDDQGWRIEIKRYPRLTDIGAWRNSRVLAWGDVKPDGKKYGGYYTQDDIREIVTYARERFIEIVPEIDIPGHSQAAVAAYPELLACDPNHPHEVWLSQGISTDIINVSNPKAVKFAKDVIDEVTELFPFDYIHLGGDECPVEKWKANTDCQRLLQAIGSTDYRDLQIHFYHQLKKHIASKKHSHQRRLIFWNEVLHTNTNILGNDITIMAWIGAGTATKEAIHRGMQTILSPQIPYYINRRQSNLPTEPHSQGSGTETLEAVYRYEPYKNIQTETTDEQKLKVGIQANFWTEWVDNPSTLQYLLLPRLVAVAEAAWTPQVIRNYPDFLNRLQAEAEYYIYKGVNFGKHVFQ